MLTIEQVDLTNKRQIERFINLPYRLYAGCPQWVPPLRTDARRYLNLRKHPFYEHSSADFFLAVRDGRDIGRLALLEHRPFNAAHGTRQAQFYFFDCDDDQEAATALFTRAFEWAAAHKLTEILGPKGFSVLDGFGILVAGFEHRQMMNLTNYNYPYYQPLLERLGFTKAVDLISCQLDAATFHWPPWLDTLVAQVEKAGQLQVQHFTTIRDLVPVAPQIIQTYNVALAQNWEYYPFSPREVSFVVDTVKPVVNPHLIKVIRHGAEMAGVLISFPDLSAALQRARGRLTPWRLLDLLMAVRRRPPTIAIGCLGLLPAYRLLGGNALLFAELQKTVAALGIQRAELLQIPDTALQMRRDLATLGIKPHKTHRVYVRHL